MKRVPHPRLALSVAGIALAAVALAVVGQTTLRRNSGGRQAPLATGEAFVFSEEGPNSTAYWLADATNPSVRRHLATITHRSGWSGEAAVAPNGRSLAYTMLPPAATNPDRQAELWLLSLDTAKERRLDAGVDLRSFLVWSPDSQGITFERSAPAGGGAPGAVSLQLWRQSLSATVPRLLADPGVNAMLVPAGYTSESNALVCARLSQSGIDIVALAPNGSSRVLAHSNGKASRDFSLSPDRSRLAFLAISGSGPTTRYSAYIADLGDGQIRDLGLSGGEDVGLAWQQDGTLTVGAAGAEAALRNIGPASNAVPATYSRPAAGFEQPLAWSPQSDFLAVRAFSGSSTAEPGAARDELIASGGVPRSIVASDPTRFVGWIVLGGNLGAS